MKRITRSAAAVAEEPLPLQVVTPLKKPKPKPKPKEDPRNNKWQLVTYSAASNSAERFGLPDGWCFQEVPRGNTTTTPQRVDRYYIEPGSGQKFRSLVAVRRYLSDGKIANQATVDKQAIVDKQVTYDKVATMHISPRNKRCSPSFILPSGWIIEKKQRINNTTMDSDKYYVEPGTGRRFRSLVAVERYLTEENEHAPLQALIPADKLIVSNGTGDQKKRILSLRNVSKNSSHLKDCNTTPDASRLNTCTSPSEHLSSPKKETPLKASRTSQLDSSSRPPKVKWVLVDRVENEWTPFIDNSKVTDSVMQKWSDIFKSTIYGENISAPVF